MGKHHQYKPPADDLNLPKIVEAWEQDGTLPPEAGDIPRVDEGFLPHEVRCSDLKHMSIEQLEGRLAYYTREATFERDKKIRAENRTEMERTQQALDIRKAYLRKEAERVFE